MKEIKYYCDCCGATVPYESLMYCLAYNKHNYEHNLKSFANHSIELCPKCMEKVKDYVTSLKK